MNPPRPHYLKLKQYILRHITSGHWPQQSRVPSEHDLARQFGLARMTVNRALRELADAGVLERIRGVGTFVAGARSEPAMFDVRSIRDEILARGRTHTVQVQVCERVPARRIIAAMFGLAAGSGLFHTRLLHRASGKPLQLEDRFVNPACAPDYLDVDFHNEIPHQHLMRVAPLARAEHLIQASSANRRLAAQLEVPQGAPLLVLTRRTWSRGRVASYVRLTHPASRYRLTGSFEVGAQ